MSEGISKPGWRNYRFDAMATMVNDRVDDPSEANVNYYVGLEHLDTDSLTIRRWGSPADVEATKLRFRAGDIIFGRRRVYQRKLGVAHFDGICSAHAMVLRAKSEVALQEFLPFFMQTDLFMDRAKEISVGSLSPTINWNTLAKEEFALPPLEEQRRLAEALSAFQTAMECQRQAQVEGDRLRRSLLLDIFRRHRGSQDFFPSHWTVQPASEAGGVQLGQQRHPKFRHGSNVRPYLRVANVFDGWIDFADVEKMHFPESELEKFELLPGDILLNEGQSTELVGRSAIYRGEIPGCCFQKTLIRFRCKPGLLPEFAHAFFQHCLYTGQFASMVVQTTSMAHLTAVRFKEFRIPVPPIGEQQQLIDVTRALRTATAAMIERGRALSALGHTFVSEVCRAY